MASTFDSNMNFRVSAYDKKLIETAAKLKGLKPNTYARQKLLEVAERDILEMNQINTLNLSANEWAQFVKIMEAPIKINQNLKKAVSDFKKLK